MFLENDMPFFHKVDFSQYLVHIVNIRLIVNNICQYTVLVKGYSTPSTADVGGASLRLRVEGPSHDILAGQLRCPFRGA